MVIWLTPLNCTRGLCMNPQLEANHVIDKKQVWIGTLSHGPSGNEIRATYQHTESHIFQVCTLQ